MASELKLSKRDRAKWEAMRQRIEDMHSGACGYVGELGNYEALERWLNAMSNSFSLDRPIDDQEMISRPPHLSNYSSIDKATDTIWALRFEWDRQDSRKAKVKNAP